MKTSGFQQPALGQPQARIAATHRDSVLAEVPREAPCAVVDGELGAVLHVGAGFGAIILVVQPCSQGRGQRDTQH